MVVVVPSSLELLTILYCLNFCCKITISFFPFLFCRRIIYETSGNLHVIKFVGLLLQLISDVQMRKSKVIHSPHQNGKMFGKCFACALYKWVGFTCRRPVYSYAWRALVKLAQWSLWFSIWNNTCGCGLNAKHSESMFSSVSELRSLYDFLVFPTHFVAILDSACWYIQRQLCQYMEWTTCKFREFTDSWLGW